MKKKVVSLTLVFILLLSALTPTLAVVNLDTVYPSLYFSGTTANCEVTISALGKNISATLELWQGNTKVDSWYESGSSYVVINGTYPALSGREYTVRVVGTIGGDSIECPDISDVCP